MSTRHMSSVDRQKRHVMAEPDLDRDSSELLQILDEVSLSYKYSQIPKSAFLQYIAV